MIISIVVLAVILGMVIMLLIQNYRIQASIQDHKVEDIMSNQKVLKKAKIIPSPGDTTRSNLMTTDETSRYLRSERAIADGLQVRGGDFELAPHR